MSAVIFQPTDLVGSKRRAFLDAAKNGRARLRDSDGTSIVALSEAELEALDLIAVWSGERDRLFRMLLASEHPLTTLELGSLAWLHSLDREDQFVFATELREALTLALSRRDGAPIRDTVHAWQVTATEMEDPSRRTILLHGFDEKEFVDAGHDLGEASAR